MEHSEELMIKQEELPPGLSIIHSNRLENLRAVAVEWIRMHPLTPLENEIFLVQSNGMAQWLKLGLAGDEGCGISAALTVQLPGRFLWQVCRAVLGDGEVPFSSPFDRERLLWRLMRLLPELLSESCFSSLAGFLLEEEIPLMKHKTPESFLSEKAMLKRYQLACRLADLYDQYQVYRADWLDAWGRGDDCLINGKGERLALPEDQAWQAALWRRIRADVPLGMQHVGRGELHKRFLEAAETMLDCPGDIPRRVIVFGISSLPAQVLEALHALSRHSQVLLFVHNPCRHYWADIIADRDLFKIQRARHPRRPGIPEVLDPDLMHQHVNPLLAAWGRQGRDYIGLLYGYDRPEEYQADFEAVDLFEDVVADTANATLLQEIQQAVLDLEPLPCKPSDSQNEKRTVSGEDTSISFQLTHSRQREVEILHDQLLRFFERNSDLTPRDIIVMTPDIDSYAPHIAAVFGNIDAGDRRYIPFSIADNPERSVVPLLTALEKLLGLPDCRMTSGDFMELVEVNAFRKRFGLKTSDLPMIQKWIQGAGICWGIDGDHRAHFNLPMGLEENTWFFGLRRMLLGYASGSGEPWHGIEPYDEIGGLDAVLVGPVSNIVEKLDALLKEIDLPATPKAWAARIKRMAGDFFEPETSNDRLLLNTLDDLIDGWLSACRDADFDVPIKRSVVQRFILDGMTESSISQRFLAGMVNFCTMMPMRAIPFQVVCLLGMNDGEYPRSQPPMDFDLMATPGCYRPGDRSRREDDRYLFLEALLSARQTFYVSVVARSIRDNSERMPSVLVGQLRDYIAAGWQLASGEDLLERLTWVHPLQPFSRVYFKTDRPEAMFTYAGEWRKMLADSDRRGSASGRETPDKKSDKPLSFPGKIQDRMPDSPQFEGTLQIAHLMRFMKNPVQYFFNNRLKVYFDEINVKTMAHEPFSMGNLAPFEIGDELLQAGLDLLSLAPGCPGNDVFEKTMNVVEETAERLLRTGKLPLRSPGKLAMEKLIEPVKAMLLHHHGLLRKTPFKTETAEVLIPVSLEGCGCEALEDWLDGLFSGTMNTGVNKTGANGTVFTAANSVESEESVVVPLNPLVRWEFYPGEIMDAGGNITRLSAFIGLWIRHLSGAASGIPLFSYLIAPDGVAGFSPLERASASTWLDSIIELWWMGMGMPLPVTAKTGLAWQKEVFSGTADINKDIEKKQVNGKAAASRVYQGDGYHSLGELGYSPYLQRTYPDFDTLWTASDNMFVHLSERLYRPLILSLETGREDKIK